MMALGQDASGSIAVIPSLVILALAVWLWAIIDCLMNETDSTRMLLWVGVILVLNLLGVLLYLTIRRPQRRRDIKP